MADATDRGIISEQVAALWGVHTETLIQAVEQRGYKVVTNALWNHIEQTHEEVQALEARLAEVDPDG